MKLRVDKRRKYDLPSRVLFLNDVGFQYGAGIAQARQVEAMLALGIETGVLCWASGEVTLEQVATREIDTDLWRGLREVHPLEGGKALSDAEVTAGLLAEVARFDPAVVVVGNLHAARWSFHLLPALASLGCRVVAFLHDAYLYTGRCAYPGSCRLYLAGCDATCPTATEYPPLAPGLIADAWRLRREVFGGPRGIDVVANSDWSRDMFRAALPQAHRVETVELGANELVFKPGDKRLAREELGLPVDKAIILCAAVNFQEARKGGAQLRAIVEALRAEAMFVAFGHNAAEIPGVTGLGYHVHADQLARCYQAADLFLGTATEEAFGQTIMEAQLCGLPAVAFQTGGVVEIIRNEITGRLVPNGDVPAAIAAIRGLIYDSVLLASMGVWSRIYAEERYALRSHAERWNHFFVDYFKRGPGLVAPVLRYPLAYAADAEALERHRPSWPGADPFLSAAHAAIFERTRGLPGWQQPGDTFKLYELGYHTGDVILEIGTFGGRSATATLRGALANPARTLRPQFYGIDIEEPSIARTRATLVAEELGGYCHLFHGTLQEFVARWSIRPTMVFLDGDHSYAGVAADLRTLSEYLAPGTPVLMHDFLNTDNDSGKIGVFRAAREWEAAGGGRFMGCFGCCALYLTLPR